MFTLYKFTFLLFINLLIINFATAVEEVPDNKICQKKFNIDLRLGDKHPQVLELQKFLNSDERTIVAPSGPGSPGLETNTFGQATIIALVKLQKLFAASGLEKVSKNLDLPTRTLLNQYCENFRLGKTKRKNTSIFNKSLDRRFNEDIILEQEGSVANVKTFRIKLYTDENMQKPDKSAIACDGCIVTSIRKINNHTYTLLIDKTRNFSWEIFVEADKVKNYFGNLNEKASNILRQIVTPKINNIDMDNLDISNTGDDITQ